MTEIVQLSPDLLNVFPTDNELTSLLLGNHVVLVDKTLVGEIVNEMHVGDKVKIPVKLSQ